MKIKRITAVILVLGLIVIGFNPSSLAFGPGYNSAWQRPGFNNQPNPLNLTDEQREKLNKIQQDFFTGREQLGEEIRGLQIELRDQYYAGNQVESDKLIEEINALQKELLERRSNMWTEIQQILSAEQLKDLQKFQEQAESYRAGYQNGSGARPGFGMRPGFGRSGYGMRPGFGMGSRGYGMRPGFGSVNPGYNNQPAASGQYFGCPWF